MVTKEESLFRQFKRLNRKSREAYVVSGIWHRIDSDEVEMITQQYVRRKEGGHALTDAYFPQFNLHIEVDEGFHRKQVVQDDLRKQDIVDATGHEVVRIKADVRLAEIHRQIEGVAERLRAGMDAQRAEGSWKPWDPAFQHSPERYRALGEVSISNGAAFHRIADACNAFGHDYSGYQKAWASNPLDSSTYLWFPKLYENRDWANSLSEDGCTITELCLSPKKSFRKAHHDRAMSRNVDRITFAHGKSPLGETLYRFVGVFRTDKEASHPERGTIYRRIATAAPLR